jgi:hypothetical protein
VAGKTRLLTWNGHDVPPEFRELPVGRYIVEAIDDEGQALSPEKKLSSRRRSSRTDKAASSRRSALARLSTRRSGVEGHLNGKSVADVVEAITCLTERNLTASHES